MIQDKKMKSGFIRETQGQRPAWTLFKVHLHIHRHAYTQRAHIYLFIQK